MRWPEKVVLACLALSPSLRWLLSKGAQPCSRGTQGANRGCWWLLILSWESIFAEHFLNTHHGFEEYKDEKMTPKSARNSQSEGNGDREWGPGNEEWREERKHKTRLGLPKRPGEPGGKAKTQQQPLAAAPGLAQTRVPATSQLAACRLAVRHLHPGERGAWAGAVRTRLGSRRCERAWAGRGRVIAGDPGEALRKHTAAEREAEDVGGGSERAGPLESPRTRTGRVVVVCFCF